MSSLSHMYYVFYSHRPSQQAKALDERCIGLYPVCISEINLGSRDLPERGTKAKLRARPTACVNASLKMVLEVFRLHSLCYLAILVRTLFVSAVLTQLRSASAGPLSAFPHPRS